MRYGVGFFWPMGHKAALAAALGNRASVADRAWSIGQLVDAALAVAPALPTETPPDRRRKFAVMQFELCTQADRTHDARGAM